MISNNNTLFIYIKIRSAKQSIASKNNIKSLTNLGRYGSNSADALFLRVYNEVLEPKGFSKEEIFTESFGKKREWFIKTENGIKFYDFCVHSLNLIIEYNGIHVHPKEKHQEGWKHAFVDKGSEEAFENDSYKEKCAIENGFVNYVTIFSDENEDEFIEKLKIIVNTELEKY